MLEPERIYLALHLQIHSRNVEEEGVGDAFETPEFEPSQFCSLASHGTCETPDGQRVSGMCCISVSIPVCKELYHTAVLSLKGILLDDKLKAGYHFFTAGFGGIKGKLLL